MVKIAPSILAADFENLENEIKDVEVANQNTEAEIGKTDAKRKERVETAELEAKAVEGENIAKANIADYNAILAVKQAEALRTGEVAKANAERDVLLAQKEREEARLKKEELAVQEVERLAAIEKKERKTTSSVDRVLDFDSIVKKSNARPRKKKAPAEVATEVVGPVEEVPGDAGREAQEGDFMKLTVEKVCKVVDLFFDDLQEDLLKIVPKTEKK